MTSAAEAESLILARMPALGAETVTIAAATGRVLRAAVRAERDQPPFDRVTMDGIAIDSEAWRAGVRRFAVQGTQPAGVPPLELAGARSCIRIMTGAVLPAGADTVVPIERVRLEGGTAVVADDADVAPGRHVHARGTDGRQGAVLLEPGLTIGPAEIAVIASAGVADVPVAALPRVAVVSTGDELVDIAGGIEPHEIRSTNDLAIAASLVRHGLGSVTRARLRDDEQALLAAVDVLHTDHDVLILSGGVSMGDFDFVPAVLERLGVELVFHRIEQKPGRPMWFGVSGEGKPVFALPGNPVSTLVCLTRYLLPALRQAAGLTPAPAETVVLDADVAAPPGLTYFLAVRLVDPGDGTRRAVPRPTNTSGDFVTLAGTTGIVELPAGPRTHAAGTAARLYRW